MALLSLEKVQELQDVAESYAARERARLARVVERRRGDADRRPVRNDDAAG